MVCLFGHDRRIAVLRFKGQRGIHASLLCIVWLAVNVLPANKTLTWIKVLLREGAHNGQNA